MNPSSNPFVRNAVQNVLLAARIESLRRLIEPLTDQKFGEGQSAKEYQRLLGVVCAEQVLALGDRNPALAELVGAELQKMKEELGNQGS